MLAKNGIGTGLLECLRIKSTYIEVNEMERYELNLVVTTCTAQAFRSNSMHVHHKVQWSTHATSVTGHNSLTAQTCSHALLLVRYSATE